MTKRYEWDWPPEPEHFERVEILPPRQRRIEVTIRHRRSDLPQRLILTAAIVVVALILLRSPGALLMLAVLIGPSAISAVTFGLSVAAVVTIWRRGLRYFS